LKRAPVEDGRLDLAIDNRLQQCVRAHSDAKRYGEGRVSNFLSVVTQPREADRLYTLPAALKCILNSIFIAMQEDKIGNLTLIFSHFAFK
jgi:hypothetical protein